jgi:hypothetical protein
VAELPTVDFFGTVEWLDLDGDGDLDYITSGYRSPPDAAWVTWVYRTTRRARTRPHRPVPPCPWTGTGPRSLGDRSTFSWGAADDDHTPRDALTYNLWVQTRAGSDIVSPNSIVIAESGPLGRLAET